MPADDYTIRVEPTVAVLRRVSGAVLDDIDEVVGGVRWWDGQVDFRRRVVLSEYLIDAINGAAEALLDAALEAQTHRELQNAEDAWLVRRWTEAAEAGASTSDDYFKAMRREGVEVRRNRQLNSSATHVVSHLLRALDCLSAALIIVGAVPQPVRRADWTHVVKLADQCRDGSDTTKLEPLGRPGRELQADLFAHALNHPNHGPEDWLAWLSVTRNSRIHRGARVTWHLLHGSKRRVQGLLRPFPTNPDLTDVELMGRRPVDSKSDTFDALRLIRHSTAIVDGCLDSMSSFVRELAEALEHCWTARREAPAVLCQRGAQWQDLERVADLRFPGYGVEPQIMGKELHVGPDLAKRLKSAHVMDEDRARWDE